MPFPPPYKIVLEDEVSPPFKPSIEALQELVKALEAGGYDAAPGTLVQGSAPIIEDLSPVMKAVMYGDPVVYEEWEKRCLRIAKVFRFLRMNGWAHMIEQAAYRFESKKKRYSIRPFKKNP